MKRREYRLHLGLQLSVMLYACTGIFTKLASKETFLSFRFLLFYAVAIFIMLVYAVLWQQFLRKMPLTKAYSHRSMSTIWSMLIGCLLFRETVSVTQMIGAAVLIVGVYLIVTGGEEA